MPYLSQKQECQLIEKARAGSQDALEELADVFHGPIRGCVQGKGLSPHDAEDVAQNVWIEVQKRIRMPSEDGGYDPDRARLFTYTSRIASSRVVDWWRERQRAPRAVDDSADEDDNESRQPVTDPEEDPSQIVERLERLLFVNRELFRLAFLCGGYPHEQLAFAFVKLIDQKPTDVESAHGRKRLGELVEEFLESYRLATRFAQEEFNKYPPLLGPLRARLSLAVGLLFERAPEDTRDLVAALAQELVLSTRMQDYCARTGPTHPFSYWTHSVARRVRKVLGVESREKQPDELEDEVLGELMGRQEGDGRVEPLPRQGCNRCALREVPPCRGTIREEARE